MEDKDALEEALLRLKRALKLVRAPARVEMQKQLVPVLLSLARAAPVSSKRVRARLGELCAKKWRCTRVKQSGLSAQY